VAGVPHCGGVRLHDLGEGLAVGAALSAGELALGTFLVVGFALHNTTEGLAIVAPWEGRGHAPLCGTSWSRALAGVPTIAGAWAGGFAFTPAWGRWPSESPPARSRRSCG
jgi:ZIP family zinc transporter